MRIIPWLTEEFHSPLPPTELLQRVQANIAPPRTWRTLFRHSAEPFRGRVNDNSFKLYRIITGRNSMLPIIEGRVKADYTGGSWLRLRHRLTWFTLVFAIIWLGLVGTFISLTLRQYSSGTLLLIGMFFFGLLLFTVPFWREVDKSQPLLVQLLELRPAGQPRS